MKTTERIQYRVDSANMEVVKARSHFRDRLWSPLELFHHENSLRKAGFVTNRLHDGVNDDGKKTQIYAWDTWRVRNQRKLCGIRGRDDHKAMFGMLFLSSCLGLMNGVRSVDLAP